MKINISRVLSASDLLCFFPPGTPVFPFRRRKKEKERRNPAPFIKTLFGASVPTWTKPDFWPTVLSSGIIKNLILVGTVIMLVGWATGAAHQWPRAHNGERISILTKEIPTTHPMTEPSTYTMRFCGLLFFWTRSKIFNSKCCLLLIFNSAFPSFLAGMSHREAKINLGTFPLLGLLEFCQLATLQYWVPYLTHAKLAPPSLHPFVFFMASWDGLWGFLMALKHALTCSTYCLVCIGRRSSMNHMVSVGVSLVVPSMSYTALFCTLSSFSRFVHAIVVRPRP